MPFRPRPARRTAPAAPAFGLLLALGLSACGGGGGDGDGGEAGDDGVSAANGASTPTDPAIPDAPADPAAADAGVGVAVPAGTPANDDPNADGAGIPFGGPGPDETPLTGTPTGGDVPSFAFFVDPPVMQAAPDFASFLQTTFDDALAPLNARPNLLDGRTVPVIYGGCGFVNAFYSPADATVVLCNELTRFSLDFFTASFVDESGTVDEDLAATFAIEAMIFTMFHEIGHALDDLTGIAAGGNFESVADAIAVVIATETDRELGPLAAALIFSSDTADTSLAVHGNGPDRAGDILCWAIGGSPRTAELLPDLAQALIDGGRDCSSEYADQREFVNQLIPGFGGLVPTARAAFANGPTVAEGIERVPSR